jgi:hypothetical protein
MGVAIVTGSLYPAPMLQRCFALIFLVVALTGCARAGSGQTLTPLNEIPSAHADPNATPDWPHLGEAYTVIADLANKAADRQYGLISQLSDRVKDWHFWCRQFSAIDQEYVGGLQSIQFTGDIKPHADALIAAEQKVIGIYKDCLTESSLKALHKIEKKAYDADVVAQAAAEVLRKDLHLSTRVFH